MQSKAIYAQRTPQPATFRAGLVILLLAMLYVLPSAFRVQAQTLPETTDTVETQGGDVFFQLRTGQEHRPEEPAWHLALETAASSAIRANTAGKTRIYTTPYAIEQWEFVDSNSAVTPRNQLVNSSTTWAEGALNRTAGEDFGDVGWGLYSLETHVITGDSVYLVRLPDESLKKFYVASRKSGVYTLRSANIDGSEDVTHEVRVAEFPDAFFAYYNFWTGQAVNREPGRQDWDLLFTRYMHEFRDQPRDSPFRYYGVSGVLLHPQAEAAELITDDLLAMDTTGLAFTQEIDVVGYDWKSYDMDNRRYVLSDSTLFYVRDLQGAIWKLYFTQYISGETGSSYLFHKAQVSGPASTENLRAAGLETFTLAPNPARTRSEVLFRIQQPAQNVSLRLMDASGRLILDRSLPTEVRLYRYPLEVQTLAPGLYHLTLSVDGRTAHRKLVVSP